MGKTSKEDPTDFKIPRQDILGKICFRQLFCILACGVSFLICSCSLFGTQAHFLATDAFLPCNQSPFPAWQDLTLSCSSVRCTISAEAALNPNLLVSIVSLQTVCRVQPNLFYVSPADEKLPSLCRIFQDVSCVQVAFTAPNSSIAILALHKWLRETQERLEVKGEACLGRTTALVTGEHNLQASSQDVQLRSLQC